MMHEPALGLGRVLQKFLEDPTGKKLTLRLNSRSTMLGEKGGGSRILHDTWQGF